MTIVQFVDPNTGQCINFHPNGTFPTPAGWTDPDTPPPIPDWELGYYWTSGFTSIGSTPNITIDDFLINWSTANSGKPTRLVSIDSKTSTQWHFTAEVFVNPNWNSSSTTTNRQPCSTQPPELCPAQAPTVESWPTDGCYDLANTSNNLDTNIYDSEAPNPGSSVGSMVVNFPAGGSGTLTATVDGYSIASHGATIYYDFDGNELNPATRCFWDQDTAKNATAACTVEQPEEPEPPS